MNVHEADRAARWRQQMAAAGMHVERNGPGSVRVCFNSEFIYIGPIEFAVDATLLWMRRNILDPMILDMQTEGQ